MIDTYILLNHKSDIRKETIQPSMAQLLLSFSKVQALLGLGLQPFIWKLLRSNWLREPARG